MVAVANAIEHWRSRARMVPRWRSPMTTAPVLQRSERDLTWECADAALTYAGEGMTGCGSGECRGPRGWASKESSSIGSP